MTGDVIDLDEYRKKRVEEKDWPPSKEEMLQYWRDMNKGKKSPKINPPEKGVLGALESNCAHGEETLEEVSERILAEIESTAKSFVAPPKQKFKLMEVTRRDEMERDIEETDLYYANAENAEPLM